ncbi:MAG: hypothetical protein KKA62_05735 [Nanoarchaeota archaeon]|nr:hypothetical protein [Nanoarchaeota archaeon]MBU1644079.1 hypothetical protein [Nanoarchaeota archaeon]MBU1977425.1 hypothetical protein [Nanoarchaeota archaeon]
MKKRAAQKERKAKGGSEKKSDHRGGSKSRDQALNFMVQLSDPKNLRKDILESLREVIIFMQGYETFLRIQEEKVSAITKLRSEIKDLNDLINVKLRRYVPKGKLKGVISKQPKAKEPGRVVSTETSEEKPVMAPPPFMKKEVNELDDLELQLHDIESRLKNIR